MQVDPLFMAQSMLRRRKFEEAQEICTQILEEDPYDKAAWFLKIRAMVGALDTDEAEVEDEGLAELLMDDVATAQVPRPGTSFKRPLTNQGASQGIRPMTKGGRPVTGFARPGTQAARPTTMDAAVRTARGRTARPVTTASGRSVRIGTASMVSSNPGIFIDVPKLDLRKYSNRPALAKALFTYIFNVTNDVRKAMELAGYATQANDYKDWWWKAMLGLCYMRLGLLREAERQLLSAQKEQPTILTALLLAKVYVRLDQPGNALQTYRTALDHFPSEISLATGIARVHEAVGDLQAAADQYRKVLDYDSTNVEAIASLAAEHFYSDQPEIAMLLYRRLLQMGVMNCELLNNLGLCCFHAQQYDMALGLFERALTLADDNNMADVWYNISTIAMSLGDIGLAYQCLKLTLTCDTKHAEAFNNLAVIEHRKDNIDQARSHYQSAIQAGQIYEPHYNLALLCYNKGDLQKAHSEVEAALECFPEHFDSKVLLQKLRSSLVSL
eukprot:m.121642 g.121642  ORF g.121642 m.121642 type:complete len:499 (+) comp19633_c1_seq2:60-1556(+)